MKVRLVSLFFLFFFISNYLLAQSKHGNIESIMKNGPDIAIFQPRTYPPTEPTRCLLKLTDVTPDPNEKKPVY